MNKIGRFFASMFSEWGSRLSGPASVPLAIAALYVSGTVLKILYGTLAVLLGVLSAYCIWEREYDRAEQERERNTRPEILPELSYCFWANVATYSEELGTQLFGFVRLTNFKDVPTIIKEYRLIVETEGKTTSGPADPSFRTGKLLVDRNLPIPGTIRYGTVDMLELVDHFLTVTVNKGNTYGRLARVHGES